MDRCSEKKENTYQMFIKTILFYILDWWKGVQAVVCLALITNLGAVVTLALFTFVSSLPKRILRNLSMTLLGLAGKMFLKAHDKFKFGQTDLLTRE